MKPDAPETTPYPDAQALRRMLSAIPDPELRPRPSLEPAIEASVRYLASDAALASLAADTYWPKWDSPWWHMLLLHELGETWRIPARVAAAMVDGLNALPLKIFPIHPDDSPPGTDPHRDSQCHCALGCIYQVLAGCGLDVDAALPWIKPWFVRYQMADGGLNCDSDAYLQKGECPSSMVGTVAPFEAMLLGEPTAWSSMQRTFVDRAAKFLIERRLTLGSSSRHNAEERTREASWLELCRPRFYLYDVLRGLSALVRWADSTAQAMPAHAVAPAIAHLATCFPDGIIRLGRRSFEGTKTILRSPTGEWLRRQPATTFPLVDAVSPIGTPCPFSTREWTATRATLVRLIDTGRVTRAADADFRGT